MFLNLIFNKKGSLYTLKCSSYFKVKDFLPFEKSRQKENLDFNQ